MYVDVVANENTHESFSMLYRDVSESREVYCIKYNIEGEESPVQVIGWDKKHNHLALLMHARLRNREMGLLF